MARDLNHAVDMFLSNRDAIREEVEELLEIKLNDPT